VNAAERLRAVVTLWEVWISLALAIPLAYSVPPLLLLDATLRASVTPTLIIAIVLATVLSSLHSWMVTGRYRYLLLSLATGSGSLHPGELQALDREPGRLARAWIVWHLLTLFLLFGTPLRPAQMDQTTGLSVALLSGLMVATASLPLNGVLRTAFLRAVELAPAALARAMIEAAEQTAAARSRITRRLTLALATPTFFVALGAALITHAHLRRADEHTREITALAVARCSFEPGPGILANAGSAQAQKRATDLGFNGSLDAKPAPYAVKLVQGGVLELTAPLERGSAIVRFRGSTLGIVGLRPLLWSILAVFVAALLGYLLGASFTNDLLVTVRRVRQLGTEAGHGSTSHTFPEARFSLVEELGQAIQQLAQRFAVFTSAQQAAISAREAAVRARGLFFASVSHDLKNPLNAILGFTDLVRKGPLTDEQAESLEVIQSRGKELLALIETILDAARAEAGQLSLVYEEVEFADLYGSVLKRVRNLASGFTPQIWDDIDPEIPPLLADKVRLARALATFIAYTVRATQGGKMRLRAEMNDPYHVRIDVDVPSHLHSPKELELMMTDSQSPGKRAHRGLALGLRLARFVVDLHKGDVRVIDRGAKGAMFCITLGTLQASTKAPKTE
jgi:signal transduction histidine kinase